MLLKLLTITWVWLSICGGEPSIKSLAQSVEISETPQQVTTREWMFRYDHEKEYYAWHLLYMTRFPFLAGQGASPSPAPEPVQQLDLHGETFSLGHCDETICIGNVLFKDVGTDNCPTILSPTAGHHSEGIFTEIGKDLQIYIHQDGYLAQFGINKDDPSWYQPENYYLGLHCSRTPLD